MNPKHFQVPEGTTVKLKDYPTAHDGESLTKEEGGERLAAAINKLSDWQSKLYAQNVYGLLVVLQGIDASGKDSMVRHVMSQLNPAGCQVKSFKVPTLEELDHDYLWRYAKALPERGNIGVFNRSHYEEVLVVRVHPELLGRQKIPRAKRGDKLWKERFDEINNFERYLVSNGIEVLKFFLHLSKKEQKKRFLDRLESPEKHWKFSADDVAQRTFWDVYRAAFEDMLSHTSTSHAPWHIIPADQKWLAHLAVAEIIVGKLASLDVDYPKVDKGQKKAMEEAKRLLEQEAD